MCDDGDFLDTTGYCSADCTSVVGTSMTCFPTKGTCVTTPDCSAITKTRTWCDDGNNTPYDGCTLCVNDDIDTWNCLTTEVGSPCIKISTCGNGMRD